MADIEIPEEYSLDDLMADAPEVEVEVGKKTMKFWIRPPTDPEKGMSQNVARRKSRELRARLEDPETEEHELLVKAELENMTPDEMRLIWLTSNLFRKTFELSRRSLNDRDEYFVPAPEGQEDGVIPPTNEDMDRYEQDKLGQEMKRLEDQQEQQTIIFKELQAESQAIPQDDLGKVIYPLIIEQQVSKEWNNQYGLQVLVRCTFSDKDLTKRAFEGTEQAVRLMNTQNGQKVLDALLNAHSGLMLDPDRLKN